MRTLILAGSYKEAAKYARGKGLKSYRYAVNAEAVERYPAQAVVELPGYEGRRDKFALEAVIRRLRRVERVKDSFEPEVAAVPQYGEPGHKADLLFGDVEIVVETSTTDRVNASKKPETVENKVSGPGKKSSPRATKPKAVTSSVDDLFED